MFLFYLGRWSTEHESVCFWLAPPHRGNPVHSAHTRWGSFHHWREESCCCCSLHKELIGTELVERREQNTRCCCFLFIPAEESDESRIGRLSQRAVARLLVWQQQSQTSIDTSGVQEHLHTLMFTCQVRWMSEFLLCCFCSAPDSETTRQLKLLSHCTKYRIMV